jgi:hypothetical protein
MLTKNKWAKLRLFLKAASWLTLMRIAISVAPFHRLRSFMGLTPGEDYSDPLQEKAESIGWAVRASARRLPWHSTCLCQALAAAIMLRRMGIAGTLHLGVGRDMDGALTFHAWLRCNDLIVTGGEGRERYLSMSTFKTFPKEKSRLQLD